MSMYKPYRDRRKALEDAVKDLSPGIRELARDAVKEYTERSRHRASVKNQQNT